MFRHSIYPTRKIIGENISKKLFKKTLDNVSLNNKKNIKKQRYFNNFPVDISAINASSDKRANNDIFLL